MYDSSGISTYFNYYSYTFSSSASVPQDFLDRNSELFIVVLGFTGPLPDDTSGNVFGNLVKGTIRSMNKNYITPPGLNGWQVIVGSGVSKVSEFSNEIQPQTIRIER